MPQRLGWRKRTDIFIIATDGMEQANAGPAEVD